MEKNSVLYQLMDVRMNGIMNKIVMADEEYREITRRADIALEKIEALHLPPETMQLIDRYVSEQNANGSRYGMLAYMLGFSDCTELFLDAPRFPATAETDSRI